MACAASQGFALLDGPTLNYFCKPIPADQQPHTRFNDGACDSKGRFFAGTVYSEGDDVPGMLYRYDPTDRSVKVVDEGPFTVRTYRVYTVIGTIKTYVSGFEWFRLEFR